MERIFHPHAHEMNIEVVEMQILNTAKWLSQSIAGLSWYLFGSSLRNISKANDIDILITHNQVQESSMIRDHLKSFVLTLPVHLVLLTEQEEIELKFVQTQGCKRIFPPYDSH